MSSNINWEIKRKLYSSLPGRHHSSSEKKDPPETISIPEIMVSFSDWIGCISGNNHMTP